MERRRPLFITAGVGEIDTASNSTGILAFTRRGGGRGGSGEGRLGRRRRSRSRRSRISREASGGGFGEMVMIMM